MVPFIIDPDDMENFVALIGFVIILVTAAFMVLK